MTDRSEATVAQYLVEQIKGGNKKAEHELIERYQRGLLFVLRRKCNQDTTLAQDMMQDTWRIVIDKIRSDQIRNPDKLSSFIVQTGKNTVIAHYRKAENKTSISIDADEAQVLQEHLIDQQDNPEEFLQRYNLALLVKKLVLEMDVERDKQILLSVYFLEQDKRTVCANLKVNSAHFDRVLYRAKQRYRKMWEKYQSTS
ncbi:MAG: sigma-70 family RNA polymerase sigma factor [Alteromonadaceae bacterium]|nr:sigma-70 family RNA polymerase sigma factor [Alteromonadaceae bacterium]